MYCILIQTNIAICSKVSIGRQRRSHTSDIINTKLLGIILLVNNNYCCLSINGKRLVLQNDKNPFYFSTSYNLNSTHFYDLIPNCNEF